MAKKRIHQIAKELDVASADIVFLSNELGIEVKTASSGLTPDEEELVVLAFKEKNMSNESTQNDEVSTTVVSTNEPEVSTTEDDEDISKETILEEKEIDIVEVITGSTPEELSDVINIEATQIVGDLMSLGIMQSMTSELSDEEIEKLLEKYDLLPEFIDRVVIKRSEIIELQEFEDDEENLSTRSPIITVMGHVDHGKTSLLDYIRNEKVADGEAGGITQHVGAYKVDSGELGITFIDTPGHEAFTQMRARGANVTDIVVLVVAADDGIMPQTIEAINHSKAAGVPIVVAVNKCDLPDANPALVKADLTKYEIIAEDLGGDTPVVEVSALKGDGVDDLLETLSLVAEIEELKSNPNTNASGYIIESRMEVGRGNVATVVVTRGTLKQGDFLYAGGAFCRVKSMFDHTNKVLNNVIPGSPVDIIGWDESPNSGDQFVAVKNQKEAKSKADQNKTVLKDFDSSSYTVQSRVSEMMKLLQEGELNTINVILKADTNGSVEAIKDGLLKLSSDEVQIQIVHAAVGGIVLSDVDLAGATSSLIVGFNVRPDSQARNMAQSKGIDVRTYQIIYELLDDITEALQGEMTIKTEEAVIGMVEVRTTFRAPKVGVVAGSVVTEGRVEIDSKARLLRNGVVVYEGTVTSLRRFKDNVERVLEGLECGIGLTDYKDIKEGDVIEILGEVEIK
ncbi:translation initiation factor IF-2 [Candidatus Actinomarina]|jgi:translation initiation factor IF-2|nr:translation initiation factor IF-2 [Candidatus Actinomarina sp.]MDC1070919.1 translation initiation factor IF-2 [Acidimicrobiia bacterium]|tara:strand:+ start:130 stop:2175 length:2046 start_codon:yes stop_codon:yes gene_type:complete